MGYPPELQEKLKRLESTRSMRMKQKIPLLIAEEKQKLLKDFHPDYRQGVKRKITVGENTGDNAPNELVDILEGCSHLNPDAFDTTNIYKEVDVLIVGGGGAGAMAALTAQEKGVSVLLTTKLRLGDSNTIMSEGGMQAATGSDDSPILHYIDTMGGSHNTAYPDLVKTMVLDAPKIIQWLEELGVGFIKDAKGNFKRTIAGGQSRPRVHYVSDYTGLEIMKVLRDEILNRNIPVEEFAPLVELLLDEQDRCTGAVLYDYDTGLYKVIRAKTVILTTGGIGRLHIQRFPTTNHYGATADGLVLAYRAGAKLCFVDAIQFHPTGTAFPEQILGLLVTEVFRSRGAQLVNVEGQRYINELETRDVCASANIREVQSRKKGVMTPTGMSGVWLDTPIVDLVHGEGCIEKSFEHLLFRFNQFDIDIRKEPILIYPAQHYQNGGIETDIHGETKVSNLFAAGEVAGGVHGRNRLGGNSLLDIFVFGRRAGIRAAEKAQETKSGKLTLDHVRRYHQILKEAGIENPVKSPLLLPDYKFEKALTQVTL